MKSLRRTVATAAAMLATAATPAVSPGAVAAHADGPCAGQSRCRVVAHADVDGDRRADAVAFQKKPGGKTAVVRVLTATGQQMSRAVDVRGWLGGGRFGGAAHVDGEPGVEVLVGSTLGAHTPFYTMLTDHGGRLVVERSPRGDSTWFVDAAASVYVGWWRRASGAHVTMTYRSAVRHVHGAWSGGDIRYRWQDALWKQVSRTHHSYAGPRAAGSIYGWHVDGLEREPGL